MNIAPLVIGVIERLDGASPLVIAGLDATTVRRAAAEYFLDCLDEIEYIDEQWIADNPGPNLDDTAAVQTWLQKLSDTSTDALFTLREASATTLDSFHYLDVRGQQ